MRRGENIASEFIYDTVIRPAAGFIDADEYEEVEANVAESSMAAWMRLVLAGPQAAPRAVRSHSCPSSPRTVAVQAVAGWLPVSSQIPAVR